MRDPINERGLHWNVAPSRSAEGKEHHCRRLAHLVSRLATVTCHVVNFWGIFAESAAEAAKCLFNLRLSSSVSTRPQRRVTCSRQKKLLPSILAGLKSALRWLVNQRESQQPRSLYLGPAATSWIIFFSTLHRYVFSRAKKIIWFSTTEVNKLREP